MQAISLKRSPVAFPLLLAMTTMSLPAWSAPFDAIVNEMSQGSSGSKEWVELLVTVDNLDMRGWELGDNDDGTFSPIVEFTQNTNWNAVASGTVIVIFNGGDVDGTISSPDLDFSDGAVLIPHSDATFFVDMGNWPSGVFGNNDRDDTAALRDAADSMVHDMAVTHPTATVSSPGGGEVKSFIQGSTAELSNENNWTESASTAGTPGEGNSDANSQWVLDLRGGPQTNQPPALAPIGDKMVEIEGDLVFDVTALDLADGDDITLSTTNLPPGASFPPVTQTGGATNTFTWLNAQPIGVYTTTFFAADIDGTNSETILITVKEVSPIVISEIMKNPGAVSDSAGEWFEIFNRSFDLVNIDGWTIKDDGGNNHIIDNGAPLLVPPFEFLVLGNNANTNSNGGVSVAYRYTGVNLANDDDEIVLVDTTLTEIARVNYLGGPPFPNPESASMYLIGPDRDPNEGSSWAESTTPWPGSFGDFGSPGEPNPQGNWDPPPAVVVISNLVNVPALVDTGDTVNIQANISPGTGASNLAATTFYRVGSTGSFLTISMSATGNLYTTTSAIPPQARGSIVQFFLSVAFEGPGTNSPTLFPPGAPDEPAFYGLPRLPAGSVWINEINYVAPVFVDTDTNEFIEIAGRAGSDISDWSLELIEPNATSVYDAYVIENTVLGNTTNGFGFRVFGDAIIPQQSHKSSTLEVPYAS